MKTCPNCGNQVPDEAVFCNNCGTSMKTEDNANAQAQNQPAEGPAPAPAPAPGPVPTPAPAPGPAPQYQQAPYGQQQYQQPYPKYDPNDHTADYDAEDIAENKLFAVATYLFGILGIIMALLVKDSPFVKFHIKNALRLEIATILIVIPCIIPFLGLFVTAVLAIILVVVEIIAVVNAFQGKAKDVPIIGSIKFLK